MYVRMCVRECSAESMQCVDVIIDHIMRGLYQSVC